MKNKKWLWLFVLLIVGGATTAAVKVSLDGPATLPADI